MTEENLILNNNLFNELNKDKLIEADLKSFLLENINIKNNSKIDSLVNQSNKNKSLTTDLKSSLSEEVQKNSKIGRSFGWIGTSIADLEDSLDSFGCDCLECCGIFPDAESSELQPGGDSVDVGGTSPENADSPEITEVSFTGDERIDALLYPAKWTGKTITYSFLTGDKYYGSEGKIRPITDKMKGYLRNILESLEDYIDLDFKEVPDTGDSYGQIRYLFSDGPSTAYTKVPFKYQNSPKAGDVHFNRSKLKDFEAGPGSYRYETLIHETLHALDLKHPGNYNGSSNGNQSGTFLSFAEDNSNNSIMSYNRLRNTDGYSGTITPMPYDVRALQYLYGAANNKGGDTTYKFSKIDEYTADGEFFGNRGSNSKQTLWDSGGKDKFDFSELDPNNTGYLFDLREGGVITSQDNYLDTSYKARGDSSGKQYKATSRGTFMSYNMTIENVVNSRSNDTIYANDGANTFSGYSKDIATGEDTLYNTNSKDTLNLSDYSVSDFTVTANGDDYVINLSSNGQVTIKDYYTLAEGDRINILTSSGNSTPDPTTDPTTEPVLEKGTLVWEDQGFKDESAVPTGSELNLGNGVTATINWQTVNNGDSFKPFGGKDFVSFDSGKSGDHTGYLSLGFDNNDNSPDSLIKMSLDFNQAVTGVNFQLLDVDSSSSKSFVDGVEIYADGVNVKDLSEVTIETGSSVLAANESGINGFEGQSSASSSSEDGNIKLSFGSIEISELEIRYFSTEDAVNNPSGQKIGISDVDFQFESV